MFTGRVKYTMSQFSSDFDINEMPIIKKKKINRDQANAFRLRLQQLIRYSIAFLQPNAPDVPLNTPALSVPSNRALLSETTKMLKVLVERNAAPHDLGVDSIPAFYKAHPVQSTLLGLR